MPDHEAEPPRWEGAEPQPAPGAPSGPASAEAASREAPALRLPEAAEEAGAAPERHASWLELFFDLVVVAAVAQLAGRLLGDPSAGDVGLCIALYVAVWLVWTSFMLYANVSAARTRQQSMLVAMAGIAVMAAAIPDLTGSRAKVFIVAYVFTRVLGMRSWVRTRQALTSWPAAQVSAGLGPWLYSLWLRPPARYWLWGLGLALDLGQSMLAAGRSEFVLNSMREHVRRRQVRLRRRGTRAALWSDADVSEARLDLSLLDERLGLFVIIVLGEAVAQVIVAAGHVDWSNQLAGAASASFVLLVGLWWLTFRYGFTAVPHFGSSDLALRATMPIHLLTTMSITGIAAGLGGLVEHLDGSLPASQRWLLCGGVAAYFLTTGGAGLLAGAPLLWLLGWALPSVAAPVLLAVFGGPLRITSLPWYLAAVVAWQVAYGLVRRRRIEAADPAEDQQGRGS
jgi:low temperature requirement protein LtrA